ncbi:hypothetical protein ACE6H2_010302 [Prunus campanulata]
MFEDQIEVPRKLGMSGYVLKQTLYLGLENILFDEVEGFGLWFWTEDHLRKMIDEFEQIKQQLAECLGIP